MQHKLLVIDDDSHIHVLIKAQFNPRQFEVLSSYDGPAGLQMAVKEKPDLILLDVDLPTTQGFEVCRRLKVDPVTQSIPVIFLTSAASLEATVFGFECGANDYLTKPFRPTELQARVRTALRLKSTLDYSKERSIHDELTDMFDRKYFELRLDAELAVSHRTGTALGCILIDIDNMGLINTWFGRKAGDEVLKKAGHAIEAVCRREDVACRYEEDEFGVLVRDTTLDHLAELAERLRIAVRATTPIPRDERPLRITASIGIAVSTFVPGSSIVAEAQHALDRADAAGGDRVRRQESPAQLQLTV